MSGAVGRLLRRRGWWVAGTLALLVLAAAGLALTPPTGELLDGPPTGERTGFSPGGALMTLDEDELNRDLDAMRDAGARWVRVGVDWSGTETGRGRYDFTDVDRVLRVARDHDLRVLALLAYTPSWARPAGTDNHAPPTDPADFARFARTVAERHGGDVDAWEVWNEPNLGDFWSPAPDPEAYATLLRATAPELRAADPGTPVLSGGLAPAETDETRIDPIEFLERVYDADGGVAFDAVSVHPYSYPALPNDPRTAHWNTYARLPLIHAAMSRRGDEDKTVWVTEFGAPTGSGADAVDPARQARILRAGFEGARCLPWVQTLFVYSLRDAGDDASDREQNFGVLARDGSAKPAWDVVRSQTQKPWGQR